MSPRGCTRYDCDMSLDTKLHGIGMTSLRTRQRLVERLRRAGIEDTRVLERILETPRHLFVDEALASRAYEDTALPIGFGQTISQPYVVARMTEALLAGGRLGKVLEIGTGSGYQSAVLAPLVSHVYSVERIQKLLERTRALLQSLGHDNVWLKYDDGNLGWPRYGPFAGIIVTAAAPEVPEALLNQLAPGGRLVAPIGGNYAQELVVIERNLSGFSKKVLDAVSFVPLLGGVL